MRPLSVRLMVERRGTALSRPASASRFAITGGMLPEPDLPEARRSQRISSIAIFLSSFFGLSGDPHNELQRPVR